MCLTFVSGLLALVSGYFCIWCITASTNSLTKQCFPSINLNFKSGCPHSALWNLKGEKGAKLYGDMAISDHGVNFTILTNDKYVAARIRDIQ
jgi:hypothetical protein